MTRTIAAGVSPDDAAAAAATTIRSPKAAAVDAILTELGGAIRDLRCASMEGTLRTGVSMTQMHVLWLLTHHGAMAMSRLADLLDISLSNATGLVDRMEERGLIERSRVPDDRRLVLVQPSQAGTDALTSNEGLRRERLRAALGRMTDRQLERARLTFRDFRMAVQAELGTTGPHRHHFVDSAD
ncbi:MAG TPA: MarR family transcriptional regulator [Candidatus Polarisedimenticolia bacterium]|nr:MarR family transcriptional regulator [Candidatus Polarisedimenticolia bacterium]